MTHLDTRGVPLGPIPARAGIGLRSVHHEALLAERPAVGFIEAHTENYFHEGGPAVRALLRARAHYPLSLHGVGLGLGSADGVDREHLARVKRAITRFEPALVSEHACWGQAGGEYFNDLLPLPYTEEAVELLARQVGEAQDFLGVQLLIENVSAYVAFEHSRAHRMGLPGRGRGALRLRVAARRQQHLRQRPESRAGSVPRSSIRCRLRACARSTSPGTRATTGVFIDDHGSQVCEPVWELYARAIARFGALPTLVEWDNNIPSLATLVAEARRAEQHSRRRFMASLRELQRFVRRGAARSGGGLRRVAARESRRSIATTRASAFRDGTRRSRFRCVRRRVGDDYFRQLCAQYRERFPSRSGDLHWAGRDFAVFLDESSCRR